MFPLVLLQVKAVEKKNEMKFSRFIVSISSPSGEGGGEEATSLLHK